MDCFEHYQRGKFSKSLSAAAILTLSFFWMKRIRLKLATGLVFHVVSPSHCLCVACLCVLKNPLQETTTQTSDLTTYKLKMKKVLKKIWIIQ